MIREEIHQAHLGCTLTHIGLPQQLQRVSLKQKLYKHSRQAKVMEFLVAILAGLPHLQDISRAAHPLDKDQVLDVHKLSIKRQARVGAHVSAHISQSSEGKLLRFTDWSAFAGKVLRLPLSTAPPDNRKSHQKRPFFVLPRLVAQMLR